MKTFLNLTSYSPAMTFAVCSLLERRGGEEREDVLRSWLAPPTLFSAGRPPDDWGYPLALDVGEHLGLLERRANSLRLVERGLTPSSYRGHLRAQLMQKASLAFTENDDPTNELTRALAWWAHQPAYPWSGGSYEPLMEGLPFKPIRQPTRWNPFERWALFLGFAWRLGDDGVVPDPTGAINEELDHVLALEETLAAPTFVERLGGRFPVLDSGAAFNSFRETIGHRGSVDALAPPLSLALLRLERRRVIDFPALADAPGVTLKIGSLERRVAQVRRIQPEVPA